MQDKTTDLKHKNKFKDRVNGSLFTEGFLNKTEFRKNFQLAENKIIATKGADYILRNSKAKNKLVSNDMYSERLIIVLDHIDRQKQIFKSKSSMNTPRGEYDSHHSSIIEYDEDQPK